MGRSSRDDHSAGALCGGRGGAVKRATCKHQWAMTTEAARRAKTLVKSMIRNDPKRPSAKHIGRNHLNSPVGQGC